MAILALNLLGVVPLLDTLLVEAAYRAFDVPCRSHDYGYDLLRFAKNHSDVSYSDALRDRRMADTTLAVLMGYVCDHTNEIGFVFFRGSCIKVRVVMYTGLRYNMSRQGPWP